MITACGYNYRWAPLVQYTRQLIDDGRLGETTHYRGRFFSMYGRDRSGRCRGGSSRRRPATAS